MPHKQKKKKKKINNFCFIMLLKIAKNALNCKLQAKKEAKRQHELFQYIAASAIIDV